MKLKRTDVDKFYKNRDKEHWSALTTQFIYVVYDTQLTNSSVSVNLIASFPDEDTAMKYCAYYNKVQKCMYSWMRVSKRDAFWKAPKGKKQ